MTQEQGAELLAQVATLTAKVELLNDAASLLNTMVRLVLLAGISVGGVSLLVGLLAVGWFRAGRR